MNDETGRRILFVHAHPDDECLTTGATIAKYAISDVRVALICCTDGAEGEIADHLDHESTRPRLAEIRAEELSKSAAILQIDELVMFGYADSGMADTSTTKNPKSFCNIDTEVVAARIAEFIEEFRPQVLVTYNERGGYGHPDHINAHIAAMRAAELKESIVEKIYWASIPRSMLVEYRNHQLERSVPNEQLLSQQMVDFMSTPDDEMDAIVDSPRTVDAVIAAMGAHETQRKTMEEFFALGDEILRNIVGRDYYVRAKPPRLENRGARQVESDLFA